MKDLEKYSSEQLKKVNESLTEAEQSVFAANAMGKDFVFDSAGNVISETYNTLGYDRALCGSNQYILSAGSLSTSTYTAKSKDDRDFPITVQGTALTGGNLGLFKFLADNTTVEWQALYNGGEKYSDYSNCYIQTSHQEGICAGQVLSGYNSMVHNHPKGYNFASSDDNNAKRVFEENSYTNFGIYAIGNPKFKFY